MPLKWYDNPRIVTQSIVSHDFQYFVYYPSVQLNLSDPSQSFHDSDGYMATALKNGPDGFPIQYLVGHGYRRDSDAQAACQADFDRWGDQVPLDKIPRLPARIKP